MTNHRKSLGVLSGLALCAAFCCMTTVSWAVKKTHEPLEQVDDKQVAAIETNLSEKPLGVGWPITDRAAWGRLAAVSEFANELKHANELLSKPLPPARDDLYLEYTKTGDRSHYQQHEGDRRDRLAPLVIGECIENKGRFLPAINELVNAICAERTWVLPAHDGSLANFNGASIDVELWSSAMAWNLATADWLLGDKLAPATRQNLRDNIRKRVLAPYADMVNGKRQANWWIRGTNNWNAVCLAGVTGAALEQIESRHERAWFVAAAQQFSQYYLKSFTSDGYCSEGLGYWNYGFGHYVLLSEAIRQATGGHVNLLDRPIVREVARFASKIEIIDGIAPAFADCAVDAKPDIKILKYVNLVMGLHEPVPAGNISGELSARMTYASAGTFDSKSPATASTAAPSRELRSWFDQAGILIGRPAANSACHMGVALKGGNNAENHNHNDIGSYVVVLGGKALLLDPGAERYTARTFSKRRYESKLLNSFGHAVPVVAGQLQREGDKSQAEILRAEFSPATDVLEMAIGSAYRVAELKSLTRRFVYSRQGAGSLTVTDEVAFSTPQAFGMALITASKWKQQGDASLMISDGKSAVRVTIDAGGEPFKVVAEKIMENAKVHPTRIGIDLDKPVRSARITVKIEPVAN